MYWHKKNNQTIIKAHKWPVHDKKKNKVLDIQKANRPMMDYACPNWRLLFAAMSCNCCNPAAFASQLTCLAALAAVLLTTLAC